MACSRFNPATEIIYDLRPGARINPPSKDILSKKGLGGSPSDEGGRAVRAGVSRQFTMTEQPRIGRMRVDPVPSLTRI